MKHLSFQWRITLMTALLIATACIVLNLLIYHSGTRYFDTLAGSWMEYSGTEELLAEGENLVVINVEPEDFDLFYEKFFNQLSATKSGFGLNGWLITATVTLISSVFTYFVTGLSLRPLKAFSHQAEQIQVKNLTEVRLDGHTIPEFRALSHSLNRMLQRLSDSFEAQRKFAGNAAHELRTPLALMQAKLDLYRKQALSSETEDMLRTLSDQTERLSNMVKTLLSMSDLETLPRNEQVQLTPLIEEVLTDLGPLADKQNIRLIQEGEDVTMTGSDTLLYRLMFNLVENGIKYNLPDGAVTVSTSLQDKQVRIQVSDTGQGIPPEHLENVFQPFFRVDKARSRSMGSVGLGLSLVREVVRLHGGTIRIEPAPGPGSGTRFLLLLPLAGSGEMDR